MEPTAESSRAGEVSKPPGNAPPPLFEMSTTKLPNGNCYIRVAPTTAVGRGNRTPLVMKKHGRLRKDGVFNADSLSTSPMMSSPEVDTPMMATGFGDDGPATPLAGFNASAQMKPQVETSNADVVPNPRVYTPPPRLQMSMMKLPDGTCRYQRVVPATASTGVKSAIPSVKVPIMKKQGRLRKFGRFTAASTAKNPAVLSPEVVLQATVTASGDDGSLDDVNSVETMTPLTSMDVLGFGLNNITPRVINVNVGQDISSVISSVCQKGHVSVLSATGVVSRVVLHQAANPGGPITYEGQFQILRLSGLLSETGGLRVLLAGRNCQVIGGHLAGVLIAASPVEVIVGGHAADSLEPGGTSSHSQ